MIDLIERLTNEIDTKFTNWAFRGSVVDWFYFNGQVVIKDFDVVTSDPFEPSKVCPFWGPRMGWRFLGRSVDVFHEPDPGPRMQTIEARIERLKWLIEHIPNRAEKYQGLLDRYSLLSLPQGGGLALPVLKSCPNRGDQIRTMTSDLCGSKGKDMPVYACLIHGECTHSKVCRAQDDSVAICVGCDDGPWSFR
jgi:hypothetical protein